MKLTNILIAVVITTLISTLLSCKKEMTSSVHTIDVNQLEVKNLFSFKRPIDNCRFVALETTNESLMGEIDKICIEDELIFVKEKNQKLFVFSMSGKFLNKIGSIGQGPEELLTLVDFYVNKEKKYVGIYDCWGSKIVRYSFDGKFISSHNCTKKMNYRSGIIGQKGNDLLVGMSNYKDSRYAYLAISEENYNLVGEYLPYSIVGVGTASCSLASRSASHSINGFFATTLFSDSIYKFNQQNIPKPILLIKSEQKIVDAKTLSDINDMKLELAIDATSIFRKKGFSVGMLDIYATDEFLQINYPMPNWQSCEFFYCVETGKAYKSTEFRMDFFGNGFGNEATATTSKEIVYALQAERIVELRENPELFSDKNILESVKNVGEYDNPVLAFFTSGYDAKNDH